MNINLYMNPIWISISYCCQIRKPNDSMSVAVVHTFSRDRDASKDLKMPGEWQVCVWPSSRRQLSKMSRRLPLGATLRMRVRPHL